MHRLIDNDLKYGNLLLINAPHMVERYNRALIEICGRTTSLKEFHIDGSGYSPEVAKEFDDKTYLNAHGVNKKIIILSIEQEGLPVLDAWFSSTREFITQLIQKNKMELMALTSKDVVFGEMEDNTYRIDTIEDLSEIKKVTFELNTPKDGVGKAKQLHSLLKDFKEGEMVWSDDDVIRQIIDLSLEIGDVRHNGIIPTTLSFELTNYHTRHFDGLYHFDDKEGNRAIISKNTSLKKEVKKAGLVFIDQNDPVETLAFLANNNIIEGFNPREYQRNMAVLERRIDQFVIDFINEKDPERDLTTLTSNDVKQFIYKHFDDLPDDFHTLVRITKRFENGQPIDYEKVPHSTIFYVVRSADHKLKNLVNHLLAEFTTHDFVSMFISNKTLFYSEYEKWNDSKKEYVVKYLVDNYVSNKDAVRRLMYD